MEGGGESSTRSFCPSGGRIPASGQTAFLYVNKHINYHFSSDFTYQMKPLQHTQEAGKMAWKFNKCKQAVKPELTWSFASQNGLKKRRGIRKTSRRHKLAAWGLHVNTTLNKNSPETTYKQWRCSYDMGAMKVDGKWKEKMKGSQRRWEVLNSANSH